MNEILDVYSYAKKENGSYEIQKNGEYFFTCTGSKKDAEQIVNFLNEDRK